MNGKVFVFVCVSMLSSTALAGTTVRVIDGDTITLDNVTVRLYGIDAPEAGQKCQTANGKQWPCGKAAIAEIEKLVESGAVICDDRGSDLYSRTLAVCRAGDVEINEEMVASGYAWAFRKYSLEYVSEEEAARAAHLGVWQAQTTTPWEYRAERWEVARQTAPAGCPVKGNISENGQIYHAPWSPWYEKTKVSTAKGERWFCTEAEAMDAGWRAPQWGR